jgi:hypothetical protein
MERRIHIAIEDSKKLLNTTLATKEDTTKRFSLLSKRLKEISELISKHHDGEQDGMLTKKNFGPVNCISCEKNIVNMAGMPVDHTAWKKLPFRDNN